MSEDMKMAVLEIATDESTPFRATNALRAAGGKADLVRELMDKHLWARINGEWSRLDHLANAILEG
jgi:hypothetical protein